MTEFDPQQFREFSAELRRVHEPGIVVPPGIDRAILNDARASFASRRRKWLLIQRVGAGLAAAAMIAIAIRVFIPTGQTRPAMSPPHSEMALKGDTNHDGKINILDAFTVAKHIAHHEPLDPAWDVNGDGVVDQKDVDLLAHMAVRVTPEGRE